MGVKHLACVQKEPGWWRSVLAHAGCCSSLCGLQADMEGNAFFLVLPLQALQG